MKAQVYILDDDLQYATLLKGMCQMESFIVHVFNNANFFLANLPVDGILVLDLKMPNCDGIEVIRELASREVKLKLILMSGYDAGVLKSAKTLAEARNLEVIASFSKPVRVAEFVNALNMAEQAIEQMSLPRKKSVVISLEELQQAIDKKQFFLQFQPQLELKSERIVGFEALVRWHHPRQGTLYPDSFIPLAEDNHLISGITRQVLEMAFQQLLQWQQKGHFWHVSVNISANDFIDIDLPEHLSKLQERYRVDSRYIMLELTETAASGSLTNALDILNRLRLKGFRLSVDDFGTGYSSLSKLHDAPFNELKIDRKFVSEITSDGKALAIAKTCMALAKMLGMQVVSEGVEDVETLRLLADLGCDLAQGYYIGRPMNSRDIHADICVAC